MDIICKVKKAMKLKKVDLNETLSRIQEEMKTADPKSEEMAKLLQNQEQALKNKKLVKEMKRFGIPADKMLMVAAIIAIAVFAFSLDLESPKALKIAGLVLKLPICKV